MPEIARIENQLQSIVGGGHRPQQLPTTIARTIVYHDDLVIILRQARHHRPYTADKFLNIALLVITPTDDADFFHVVMMVGFKEAGRAKRGARYAIFLTRRGVQTKR